MNPLESSAECSLGRISEEKHDPRDRQADELNQLDPDA